ncbi:MAG: hypothetical protein LBQ83_07855 [Candidatus Margulisbacteria bacterium]|jgi:hypothetical protein|nr:hypothetical protein [Candidatus Margulisiibacteriota bacterium]
MANDYTGTYTGIQTGGPMKAADVTGALNKMEKVAYKTTELNGSSTDTQYPSAKAVYNSLTAGLAAKQDKIAGGTANNIAAYSGTAGTLNTLTRTTSVRAAGSALDTAIPTEKAVATALAAKQDKIAAGTANSIVAYSGTAGALNTLTRATNIQAVAAALDTAVPTEKAVATALSAKANASDVQAKLPLGTILMYDGSGWVNNSTLPGWYKCDGTNGTPDLSDRFVKGAGSLSAIGGSNALTAAMLPKHTHTIYTSSTKNTARTADKSLTGGFTGGISYEAITTSGVFSYERNSSTEYGGGWNGVVIKVDATHEHTGGANNDNSALGDSNTSNMPAYYSLIYIKRVA